MNLPNLLVDGLSGRAIAALALAGGLALVVLHLLRLRRREVIVSFVPLWLGAPGAARSSRWARRLREWLALALALTVLMLVLFGAADLGAPAADAGGRSVVILVDRSASMSARDEPGTRLGAARARALEVARGLGRADRALVASFARDALAESGFEADPARIARAIAAVGPSEEPGDLSRGLEFAAAILAGRPRPTIVLVSDGAFSEDARRAAPPAVDLRYVPVGKRGRNVAILGFAARRLPADPGSIDAAVTLQNFGPDRVSFALEVLASGATIERRPIELAPGERRREALADVFAPDARLEARLVSLDGHPLAEVADAPDDLPLDDRAYAVVPPLPRRRVLRVGGPDLYLDGALLSLGRTVTVERATEAAAARDRDTWARYDLVIFDGVAPAPPPEAGRYLYLDPHGPSSPFGERGASVRDPVIAEARRDHPLLRQIDLGDVNIAEARRLALAPGDVSVAGSFGLPLIVARERPGLRMAALSFDPRRSDLPMRAAFPLLIANALAWAAGSSGDGGAPTAVATGGSFRLTDGVTEVPVTRAGFHTARGELFAANLADARESDTTPAAHLALGGHALPAPDPPARRPPVRLPVLALVFAAALVALEWVSFHRRWTT
jgi:hypothetical protein